jgi:hypothetical protein
MQGGQSDTDAERLQRTLAIREQHLERAKLMAQWPHAVIKPFATSVGRYCLMKANGPDLGWLRDRK